jgi:hypothetical protein
MRAIWLLAVNFLREQKLALVVLLLWITGFGVVFTFWRGEDTEHLALIFRQQAAYGVLFTMFVSASALHMERKTRRIVAVLSKGITRSEYLIGYILGCALFSGTFVAALWLVNQWFALQFRYESNVTGVLLAVWIASVLAAAIALMFACWLPPLVSTPLALLTVVLPGALAFANPGIWEQAFPITYVVRQIFTFDFRFGWIGGWWFAAAAFVQSACFWLIAAAIFARKDVSAAVE